MREYIRYVKRYERGRDTKERSSGKVGVFEVSPVLKSVDNATVNETPSTCCFTFTLAPGATDGADDGCLVG